MKRNDHIHVTEEDTKQRLARYPITIRTLWAIGGNEFVLDLVTKSLSCREDWVDKITVDRAATDSKIIRLDDATVVDRRSVMTVDFVSTLTMSMMLVDRICLHP